MSAGSGPTSDTTLPGDQEPHEADVAFPPTSPHSEPPVFGENNRILGFYVLFAAVIGLFLPIAYIIEGVFEGDKEGIHAAAPHLFLLCSQVLMEGISFLGNFSLPIRVFVPVFYNSKRIFTIVEWLRSEMSRGAEYGGSAGRLYTGRALAVANMGLWCFNLFGFCCLFFYQKLSGYITPRPKLRIEVGFL
ncbi:UNVERIFIED_CONTAM: hypothetical protein Sangu_2194400 [Sesamum angustifolium]|uniref:DUF7733 domain-containing protein n=1 Tax=Sesamum angustifolium TaxID=2727405 RepID=A0AAW2LJA7_9LAMI